MSGSVIELTQPVTNGGVLEATNGGRLSIGSNIINTASGIISAGSSGGLDVAFAGVITGGTLRTGNGGGFFVEFGNPTLDGSNVIEPTNKMITLSGRLDALLTANLSLQGTINNKGAD